MPSTLRTSFKKHAKHAIFWSMPSTSFYELHQARNTAKFIEHTSTPSMKACQVQKAHRARRHASMPISRLVFWMTLRNWTGSISSLWNDTDNVEGIFKRSLNKGTSSIVALDRLLILLCLLMELFRPQSFFFRCLMYNSHLSLYIFNAASSCEIYLFSFAYFGLTPPSSNSSVYL